jgi:hypothetical protein
MRIGINRKLAAGIVLALCASPALASSNGLFEPFADSKALSNDRALAALQRNPTTASLDVVHANASKVHKDADFVELNLGKGLSFNAYRLNSYESNGMTVWSGIVENSTLKLMPQATKWFGEREVADDPMASAILVKNGDKITGNVRVGEQLFAIRPLAKGGTAIVAVNESRRPPEHPASFDRAPVIPMPYGANADTAALEANTVIRVLVNYTPGAAGESGDINGLIALAIAETNQGYASSQVAITMELAASAQTAYVETGNFDTDLARYRGTSDGNMDEIHATRDAQNADVAVLLVTNTAYCGLASGIGSTAPTAFAEVYWDCATGYYSFAHEIGHLQSARHDPKNDPTKTPYAYGHGYQYVGKGRNATKWRTIMAYDCSGGCPRLDYWSNPGVTYGGQLMGTASASDNHRGLIKTAATVAAFE